MTSLTSARAVSASLLRHLEQQLVVDLQDEA